MVSVSGDPSNFESSTYTSLLPILDKNLLTYGEILGEGGFGIVQKAEYRPWGPVAVKKCKFSMSDETKLADREIQRMVRASWNEHIVQICGIIQEINTCSIAMEFMEFGSLESIRKRLAKFPDAVKIQMMCDISLGMNFLHTLPKPIIHRDLKLKNVFVGRGLKAKVGDLGLATWYTASNYTEHAGTISHIPPENLKNINERISTKYDVYSFGIMLWEFATGKQPYENGIHNSALIADAVVNRHQRPDENEIPKDEPAIVLELMKEAWRQEPEERPSFQDIKERIHADYKSKYSSSYRKQLGEMMAELDKNSAEQDTSEEAPPHFPWERSSPNTFAAGLVTNGNQFIPRQMDAVEMIGGTSTETTQTDSHLSSQASADLVDFPSYTPKSPNKRPTEKLLGELAANLGKDWEKLASNLGLKSSEVYTCKTDHPYDSWSQIRAALIKWRNKNYPNATIGVLVRECQRCEIDPEAYKCLMNE